MGKSEENLKKICKGANLKDGLSIIGSDVSNCKQQIMK